MKLKRRIIAILMSLARMLAYMPAMAFADNGEASGTITAHGPQLKALKRSNNCKTVRNNRKK